MRTLTEWLAGLSEDIPQEIKETAEKNAGSQRNFVSYLSWYEDILVQRAFAYRRHKGKALEIHEYLRRIIFEDGERAEVVRDLCFHYLAGWQVVFPGDYCRPYSGKEAYEWCEIRDSVSAPYGPVLNPERVCEIPAYRYCGYTSGVGDLSEYLGWYRREPRVELFGKLGIMPGAMLVRQAAKDKAFCRFVSRNVREIKLYGVRAALYAYKHNMTVLQAIKEQSLVRDVAEIVKSACGWGHFELTEEESSKLKAYLSRHEDRALYSDYVRASCELGRDFSDTKVMYPMNLRAAHDMVEAQFAVKKAEKDAAKSRELEARYAELITKLLGFEYHGDEFAVVVPKSIAQIRSEGEVLKHCVYNCGYHEHMVRGGNLILFIRRLSEPDKPFVTVEFDAVKNRIVQIRGASNATPEQAVLSFADEWVKKLKKSA